MGSIKYKKTNCFYFSDNYEIKLFEIFIYLNKIYGATYMSYTFDLADTIRFSFRTDFKWAYIYHNEVILGRPIIESCPLDIVSRQKKNSIIIWDLYNHISQSKINREIMGLREDIGLQHGLTFSTYFAKHHDAIAVATEERNTDLATKILAENNGNLLKESLMACRRIAIQSLIQKNGTYE